MRSGSGLGICSSDESGLEGRADETGEFLGAPELFAGVVGVPAGEGVVAT